MLGVEFGSSGRVDSSLNYCVISPSPVSNNFNELVITRCNILYVIVMSLPLQIGVSFPELPVRGFEKHYFCHFSFNYFIIVHFS